MNRLFVLCCFLLVALLSFFACAVAPVIVHAPPGYDLGPAWQAVQDAKLPVKLERRIRGDDPVDHRGVWGKIVVWVVGHDLPGQAGHAHTRPCRGVIEIESTSRPSTWVHELGHTLLLQHSPDAPHNVMAPASSTELATEQRYFMQAGAERLKLCRRAR